MTPPRFIVYMGGLLAILGVFAFVIGDQPIAGIAFGLGFSTGLAVLSAAVKLQLESRLTCPVCSGVVTASDSISGRATRYYQCANGHRIVARDEPGE